MTSICHKYLLVSIEENRNRFYSLFCHDGCHYLVLGQDRVIAREQLNWLMFSTSNANETCKSVSILYELRRIYKFGFTFTHTLSKRRWTYPLAFDSIIDRRGAFTEWHKFAAIGCQITKRKPFRFSFLLQTWKREHRFKMTWVVFSIFFILKIPILFQSSNNEIICNQSNLIAWIFIENLLRKFIVSMHEYFVWNKCDKNGCGVIRCVWRRIAFNDCCNFKPTAKTIAQVFVVWKRLLN